MFALVVLDARGGVTLTRAVGAEPIYLGRAPTNDVVLEDPAVSSRHVAVWSAGGRAFVEDLGSRNGTWLDGVRTRGPTAVPPGATLRIGDRQLARIERDAGREAGDSPLLLVHALDGTVSVPMRHDRFRIGPEAHAHLRLDVAADEAALLILHPDGELWLGRGDDQVPLAIGEAFEIGGRAFAVKGSPARVTVTRDHDEAERHPYRLVAELSGPTGPRALLEEPRTARRHPIEAGNRAVLLYLLARQRHRDAVDGLPETHAGWCTDAELGSGIWGRAAENKNLNVLVTRVRAEVRAAGFDPWFVEKRRGHTRVRLDDIRLG